MKEPHGLASGVVYGPVESRRYGRTLGVNLLPPARKTCTLECVYCQFGRARAEGSPAEHPSASEVRSTLESRSSAGIDAIVVSGNGEPTLHPVFPEVVAAIVEARDAVHPKVPIVCLTSGTELHRPEIRSALQRLDETSVKLDAGRCETLRRVALPAAPLCVDWLVSHVRSLRRAVIQSCFFDGPLSNAGKDDVAHWIKAVEAAAPTRVDLYSISREPPSRRIRPVPMESLLSIATRLWEATAIPFRLVA